MVMIMSRIQKWVPLLKRTRKAPSDVPRVSMGSGRTSMVRVDEEVTERTVTRRRRTTYVLAHDLEQPESPVIADIGQVGMIRYEGVIEDGREQMGTVSDAVSPWAPTRDPNVWYQAGVNAYFDKSNRRPYRPRPVECVDPQCMCRRGGGPRGWA